MRSCAVCDGPTIKCPYCQHVHCDDETCPGMPIPCIQAGEEGGQ